MSHNTRLEEPCTYCAKALTAYPLIMYDDADQTVYHVACALELASDLLADVFTFFSPPTPYSSLFVRTPPTLLPPGCHAASGRKRKE